jgi:hypothetical protein
VLAILASVGTAKGQDIEPRAFSNAPIGVNFLIAGYAYTQGGLAFDAASQITDPQLQTHSAIAAYARVFRAFGQSAKADVILPYSFLSGSASFNGRELDREIAGFGDPRVRVSVNLYGAPALTLKEFASYEQDLIVGASLQVSVPGGQYDASKVVNLGANRWSFKPEVGVSKAFGPLTLEVAAAMTVFTDNQNFYNGNTRSQEPLYSVQTHAIYGFRSGIWASLDATYFEGGRTEVNGSPDDNQQRNWRIGGTLAFPLDLNFSVKLYASSGVSSRTGNNYDLLGFALQYRWGAGL